jgi:hypothetical protein
MGGGEPVGSDRDSRRGNFRTICEPSRQCRPPGLPMTMRMAARPPDYLQRNPLHPSILKLQLVYAFSERPGLAFVTEET